MANAKNKWNCQFFGKPVLSSGQKNKLHGMGLKQRKQNLALQLHVTIQMKLLCIYVF